MQQNNGLILILDDDEDIRDLLSAVLSFKGYRVSALDDIDLDKIRET